MAQPVNRTLRIAAMSAGTEIGHVSGPVVTFRGNGDPLRSLLVNIEPVQSGTGDPSPDNVRPISGWSAVKVTRTGKNLLPTTVFPLSLVAGGKRTQRIDFATPLPPGTYTVAVNVSDSTTTKTFVLKAYNVSTEIPGSYVGFSAGETGVHMATFSSAVTVSHLYMYLSTLEAAGNGISVSGISVELGSATPYEPYQGDTYTIQLGQTVYSGQLDVTGGALTVDRALVDLGTLSWTYRGSTAAGLFSSSGLSDYLPSTSIAAICSAYAFAGTVNGASSAASTDKTLSLYYNSELPDSRAIYVYDTAYTDASTFKTAMSGVQLVYELAIPITIPLTPQEISTLQGVNNVWADAGDVTVEYVATGGEGGKLALLLRNRKELLIALRMGLTPAEAGLLSSTPLLGEIVRPGLSTDDDEKEEDLW